MDKHTFLKSSTMLDIGGLFFMLMLFVTIKSSGQLATIKDRNCKICGHYGDYFSSELRINADSTFKYEWRFDLLYSWTKGKWKVFKDTIYFTIVPIYDTVRFKDSVTNTTIDTLVLSGTEKPRLGGTELAFINDICSAGQNRQPIPNKLFFKRDGLYLISENGKLIKKKQRGSWSTKKHHPWYSRIED